MRKLFIIASSASREGREGEEVGDPGQPPELEGVRWKPISVGLLVTFVIGFGRFSGESVRWSLYVDSPRSLKRSRSSRRSERDSRRRSSSSKRRRKNSKRRRSSSKKRSLNSRKKRSVLLVHQLSLSFSLSLHVPFVLLRLMLCRGEAEVGKGKSCNQHCRVSL
jgi:hypothetical protein